MLSVFRKNANNAVMIVVFAAITFVFVFTFGSWGGGNVSGDVPVAAVVNGKTVAMATFRKAYQEQFRYRSMFQPGFTADKAREEGMDQMVLDRLITQELLAQTAEDRGLRITDDEVAKAITERFFGKDKPFDPEEYKRIVQGVYNMTETHFEEQVRRELLAARFEQVLRDGQHVADAELKQQYVDKNNKVELELIKVDPLFYKGQIKDLTDDEAKQWAADHKADVEGFYNSHMTRYRQPKKVKARHILIKVAEDAPQADKDKAMEKIQAAKKRVDDGEDFGTVAVAVSEDGSAKAGGDLGYFGPGGMVKPFEDAAFALKKGQVSGVVTTKFGYHLIKAEDIQEPMVKELKDVDVEIAKQLAREASQMAEAKKVLTAALEEAKAGKPLTEVKIAGLLLPPKEGETPPASPDPYAPRYDTTGMFPQSTKAVPKIGYSPELASIAFALTPEQPLHPELVTVSNRLFLVKLKGREQADLAKFETEREALEQQLLQSQKNEVVESFVKALRDKATIQKTEKLLG